MHVYNMQANIYLYLIHIGIYKICTCRHNHVQILQIVYMYSVCIYNYVACLNKNIRSLNHSCNYTHTHLLK